MQVGKAFMYFEDIKGKWPYDNFGGLTEDQCHKVRWWWTGRKYAPLHEDVCKLNLRERIERLADDIESSFGVESDRKMTIELINKALPELERWL